MAAVDEIKKQIAALLTAAFGFVAALQWNQAIQKWLEPITSQGGGAMNLTIVAIVVTIIAVIVVYLVGRMLK